MAKPPPSPPSSDITGVNRDARAGAPKKGGEPDPGSQIGGAKADSAARPDETEPDSSPS